MNSKVEHRLLFVCRGNICRSPMARSVFAHIAEEAGMGDRFVVDSAAIESWNDGSPADARAQAAARARGYDLSGHRGRNVTMEDLETFDMILPMDRSNHAALLDLAPKNCTDKIRLFLDDAPELAQREVPNPYFGEHEDFEEVLTLVEAGARALLIRFT